MTLPAAALRFVGFVKLTTAGAGAPTGVTRSNVTVPANGTGVGNISVTLGQGGVDRAQCVVFKNEESATALHSTLVHTSDTVKQILCWDAAGAAADGTVSLGFFQLDPASPPDPGSPLQPQDLQLIAGVLLTTAGAGAPTVIENFNCGIPATGTGTGDISITLGEGGVDALNCIVAKWDENAGDQLSQIIHTSDTVKQILIFTANGDAAANGTVGVFFFRPAVEAYQ